MRRLAPILLTAALAVLAGCNSRRGRPIDATGYRGVDQGAVFAFAWGGAPGFEDDQPHDVVVLFAPQPGDRDYRLVSCDPRAGDCKRLDDFTDTGLKPETDKESFFGAFDTDVEKQDRLYVVAAVRGSRLVTSDVINATVSSRPTTFSRGELRFEAGTQKLAWPRLADNDAYVLEVSDEGTESPLTAIVTRRKSWTYPELQGIVQYLHDAASVGELRPSGRYVAVLYSVNKQGWATVVTNAVVKP